MKPLLLHRDRDFDAKAALPWNAEALEQDLALAPLLQAMAQDDELVLEVSRRALLTSWHLDLETVRYRQGIVRDALAAPQAVRAFYDLCGEAMESRRKHWLGILGTTPSSVMTDAVDLLQMYLEMLRRLRALARAHGARFASVGFRALLATFETELGDDFLAEIEAQLTDLSFENGMFISAGLGPGNALVDLRLHRLTQRRPNWLTRLFAQAAESPYGFQVPPRDEAGAQALENLRNRSLNVAANALAQAADHVRGFFEQLRTELAFYVGCLNLHARLAELGAPVCLPQACEAAERQLRCRGLFEPSLALRKGQQMVGNDVEESGKALVVITGPNQGGKSSFLRAIGAAQLMLQAGMFVAAERFEGGLCRGLFTHYRREEDQTMERGKLDEELARLSALADHFGRDMLVLFNESFAATNDREGSEIARQVVTALLERGLRVFFVTHLYAFARGWFEARRDDALFLRAERLPDGTRTFRQIEGEPLATSHGAELYARIFEAQLGDPGDFGEVRPGGPR